MRLGGAAGGRTTKHPPHHLLEQHPAGGRPAQRGGGGVGQIDALGEHADRHQHSGAVLAAEPVECLSPVTRPAVQHPYPSGGDLLEQVPSSSACCTSTANTSVLAHMSAAAR